MTCRNKSTTRLCSAGGKARRNSLNSVFIFRPHFCKRKVCASLTALRSLELLWLLLALIFLAGCASTDELVFDPTPRAPSHRVDVYKDDQKPTDSFKAIADLTFLGPAQDELRAQRYFIERARVLGGSGIICWKEVAGRSGDGFGQSWHSENKYLYKAKVIVYESNR